MLLELAWGQPTGTYPRATGQTYYPQNPRIAGQQPLGAEENEPEELCLGWGIKPRARVQITGERSEKVGLPV